MAKRGGARPGAGRPAKDPWRDIVLGGEIDAALRWLAAQRRLRAQRQSAWVQFVLREIEAADTAARRKIGASDGPLVPGGKAARFVLEERKKAWDQATQRGPKKRNERRVCRVYDKRVSAWLIARIARRHGVSADVARAALAAWRKSLGAMPEARRAPYTDGEG